jgi:ATP-dependent 26S proteasome regulatory subunit
VLLPDNSVARSNLTGVYALAAQLRPSLVVLDDIDLIIGSGRSSATLVDFLASVDGAVNSHEGIITLAATNRLQVIDEAARRSARFDRLIELPRPPAAGRARILTRYLGRFAVNADVQRIATASAGATGADLREVVRHAVLATNGAPDTPALLAAVADAEFADPAAGHGNYL